MPLPYVVLWPLVAATLCLVLPPGNAAAGLTLAAALATLTTVGFLTRQVLAHGSQTTPGLWLYADALSTVILLLVALVVTTAAAYSWGYVRRDFAAGEIGRGRLKRYYVLFNLFAASMVAVPLVNNLGLLWMVVGATTLTSAFLVWFYRRPEALEAAWKYLLLTSVGSLLALFGTVLTYCAAVPVFGTTFALEWTALRGAGGLLQPEALKLGFLLVVIGYGTKAGLAPMHTWLPDAHSQAPSPVCALLSGAELNCALYAVMRFYVLAAGGLGRELPGTLLMGFGLFSVLLAALFLLTQRDFKRLLAYSSVEHMGLVAAGAGFGGPVGYYGALFQMLNHALAKSLLFYAAGNVLHRYRTTRLTEAHGLLRAMPLTGVLALAGALAITGVPPFSTFWSKFFIAVAGLEGGHRLLTALLLLCLVAVFAGFLQAVGRLCFGPAPNPVPAGEQGPAMTVPILASVLVLVAVGFYLPPWLDALLRGAAAVLGGP